MLHSGQSDRRIVTTNRKSEAADGDIVLTRIKSLCLQGCMQIEEKRRRERADRSWQRISGTKLNPALAFEIISRATTTASKLGLHLNMSLKKQRVSIS